MVQTDPLEDELCGVRLVHLERIQRAKRQSLDEAELEALSGLFKALGDPTRLRILHALAGGEMCVCDLAAVAGVSESAVSHQLRRLRSLDLVRARRQAQVLYYALADDCPTGLVALARDHLGERS